MEKGTSLRREGGGDGWEVGGRWAGRSRPSLPPYLSSVAPSPL